MLQHHMAMNAQATVRLPNTASCRSTAMYHHTCDQGRRGLSYRLVSYNERQLPTTGFYLPMGEP